MRTLAFGATVLALLGLASPARSESIYRYRDPNTKRDVFVTRLDQIPAPYREQAKLVVADGVLVDSSNQPAKDAPLGTVIYGNRTPLVPWRPSSARSATSGAAGTTRVGC